MKTFNEWWYDNSPYAPAEVREQCKTFIRSMLMEMIGEEEKPNKLAGNPAEWKLSVMGYNRKRQEIIKTAKEYGFNLDV